MTEAEWRFGRLIRERFVGVILSRWPEYRRIEWDCHVYLGPVQGSLKVLTPGGYKRELSDSPAEPTDDTVWPTATTELGEIGDRQ